MPVAVSGDAAAAVVNPQLILALNTTLDTSAGTSKVTSITKGELLNTKNVVVANATIAAGQAKFPVTGLAKGFYFIRLNGIANCLVPTKIDNPTVNTRQYVGRRLRDSVIGTVASPKYRIQTFPQGQSCKPIVKYSNGTKATPAGYAFAIAKPAAGTFQLRYLGRGLLLSSRTHSGPHAFPGFIMGPSHHTGNGCTGCHGSSTSHPATYASITKTNGWCYKCHYGSGGSKSGFVRPTQ